MVVFATDDHIAVTFFQFGGDLFQRLRRNCSFVFLVHFVEERQFSFGLHEFRGNTLKTTMDLSLQFHGIKQVDFVPSGLKLFDKKPSIVDPSSGLTGRSVQDSKSHFVVFAIHLFIIRTMLRVFASLFEASFFFVCHV